MGKLAAETSQHVGNTGVQGQGQNKQTLREREAQTHRQGPKNKKIGREDSISPEIQRLALTHRIRIVRLTGNTMYQDEV